jgi:FkbM family methyltransferase
VVARMTEHVNYRGLSIPRAHLGARVTTDNLFDPNEQVIFDFYEANRGRYRRALDVGANVGVHSILMARQGWEVRAYEPDPAHFRMLLANVAAHGVAVEAYDTAVSDRDGTASFTRVLNNTTGSHLTGSKTVYGPTDYCSVRTVDCRPLLAWADFAKIDCEGHEAALIGATDAGIWRHLDALLEVGSAASAEAIYFHLRDAVPMWAQKIGWRRVLTLADVPAHHSEGSLFVGGQPPFPGM